MITTNNNNNNNNNKQYKEIELKMFGLLTSK